MKKLLQLILIPIAAVALTAPLTAQSRDGLMGDLLKDVSDVEKKVTDLAKAIPESAYAWRPGPGVRSIGEVFQHVASDNYFMPAVLDKPAPNETGITKDFKTAVAFETKPMSKECGDCRTPEVIRVPQDLDEFRAGRTAQHAVRGLRPKEHRTSDVDQHGDASSRAPRSVDRLCAVQ
jgi:hypothetical protein